MDDRILATAWLCLAEARRNPDPTGFALSFAKGLVRNGWPERSAKRVYFCVTERLCSGPFEFRRRAVHQVRFVISN